MARPPVLLRPDGPGLEQAAASGGSRADPVRLERLLHAVQRVCATLSALPADAAQRPAFEVLIEDRFVSGDQASWGL